MIGSHDISHGWNFIYLVCVRVIVNVFVYVGEILRHVFPTPNAFVLNNKIKIYLNQSNYMMF